VKSRNGQRAYYFRFVKAKNHNSTATAEERLNALRQSMSKALLCTILEMMGPLEHSVENLVYRLYCIHQAAAIRGINEAGGSTFVALTAEQTLQVRNEARISSTAMITRNRCVRAYQPGRKSIFATFSQCQEVESKNEIILKFDVYNLLI
jgi:hypothetical protein